jgi:anti-sigma regulatory factor (Ser/Thr protein kinase)
MEQHLTSEANRIAPARRALEAWATDNGFAAKCAADLGLCFNEALANIIRHAYGNQPGKPIDVVAEMLDDPGASVAPPNAKTIRLTIRDWGSGCNPAHLPQQPYDPLCPGGLGMICLRSLLDDVSFSPQSDGMLLTLIKRNQPGAAL